MAEKKTTTKKAATTKKASKQANPKAVDMVSPVATADETGLELTETRVNEAIMSDETIDAEAEMNEPLEKELTKQTEAAFKDDVEELENPSTDEIKQAPDDAELVFEDIKTIEPTEKAVEAEACNKVNKDDHDAVPCEPAVNQELELQEPKFKEDPAMVNDITNILNGLDGVKASKITGEEDVEEELEKEEKEKPVSHKNTTNTEEKNYYSEQFSRSWGGVMYDY